MDQGHPDALLQPLLDQLKEALALEAKFLPNLQLPLQSQDGGEVTAGIRDGSAHVLRCLKVWYDLPSEVLFVAINLMDRFLTKMKARPKHMACISVASFQLAARLVCGEMGAPDPVDVASISQCKCTRGDLVRMQAVIGSKLGAEGGALPVTPGAILRILHALFTAVDVHHIYQRCVGAGEVWQRLEILACDASCANFRPCEVALVLLCSQMDSGVAQLSPPPPGGHVLALVTFAAHLQQLCNIGEASFYACHKAVLSIVGRYNAQSQMPHRQRLVWRLSQRTLRYLRPTEKLVTTLPTIDEHGQLKLPVRPRCSSASSEENWSGEEWPVGRA